MVITDFYRKGKICISKWTDELIEPAVIAVKMVGADMETEVLFSLPVGFRTLEYYSETLLGSKVEEANLLFTYLYKSKEFIKQDRGISESKFNLLLSELRLLVAKKYLKCSRLLKFIRVLGAFFNYCFASIRNSSTYEEFICLPMQVRAHIERAEAFVDGGLR